MPYYSEVRQLKTAVTAYNLDNQCYRCRHYLCLILYTDVLTTAQLVKCHHVHQRWAGLTFPIIFTPRVNTQWLQNLLKQCFCKISGYNFFLFYSTWNECSCEFPGMVRIGVTPDFCTIITNGPSCSNSAIWMCKAFMFVTWRSACISNVTFTFQSLE